MGHLHSDRLSPDKTDYRDLEFLKINIIQREAGRL